jgi:hypothetical protein
METNNNGQVSAFVWTINATKMFLDQYKKHRKRVGTLEMKSLKQIWQWIAQQLSRDLGVTVQASHCENMRKALERNYKKHVDHQHSTGRGRRTFDFFEEMEEISGKKRAIHPHFLLGINVVPEDEEVKNTANEGTLHIKKEPTTSYAVQPAVNEQTTSGSAKRKADNKLEVPRRTTKKRQSVLESMRFDNLACRENKLAIEKSKLEELKKRNKLIEERNKFLGIISANVAEQTILYARQKHNRRNKNVYWNFASFRIPQIAWAKIVLISR